MLLAIILILLLIIPGFIAERLFHLISHCKTKFGIITGLIFDLLIFIINIIGLYYFEAIYTIQDLLLHFNCLSFCRKYGLLSILVAIILGVIFGIIFKYICKKCHWTGSED